MTFKHYLNATAVTCRQGILVFTMTKNEGEKRKNNDPC